MEFLESTNFFVRIAVYDFQHRNKSIKLKFRLIPMVHVGEQNFYDSVKEKIFECDELIYEGIQRRKGIRLINSRKKICKELGLVLQRDALVFKGKRDNLILIHGDFKAVEANLEWKKIHWIERFKENIIIPIQMYFSAIGMSRIGLAKLFMKSYRGDYLTYGPRYDKPGTAANFYYALREKKVFGVISEKMIKESGSDKTIGILYGAGHMNRISRNLIDIHGYHASRGQFIKVFVIS